MLFSSITFLFYFLPIVLCVYFSVPFRWKNHVLLLSSLFFYFVGEPIYTLLLLFSSVVDYSIGRYIEKYRGRRRATLALLLSLCINLGLLGFFKYADFLLGTCNMLLGVHIPLLHLALPVGISFFTFQTMSYTIDIYRGEVKAEKDIAVFATYVCLFPQLIAGPIVRYSEIGK